jgi:hypothetical protein
VIGHDGVALAPSTVLTTGPTTDPPVITSIGDGWAFAWEEAGDLWTSDLTESGERWSPDYFRWVARDVDVRLIVAVTGGKAVLWSEETVKYTRFFLGILDNGDFFFGDPGGLPVYASPGDELGKARTDEFGEIWFARFSLDGSLLGDAVHLEARGQPALCANGEDYLIGHVTTTDDGTFTALTRIVDDEASGPLLVTSASAGLPAIACAGDRIAAAWSTNTGTAEDPQSGIVVTVATHDLSATSSPILIATPELPALPRVQIAADGTGGYRVAWREGAPDPVRTMLASIRPCPD